MGSTTVTFIECHVVMKHEHHNRWNYKVFDALATRQQSDFAKHVFYNQVLRAMLDNMIAQEKSTSQSMTKATTASFSFTVSKCCGLVLSTRVLTHYDEMGCTVSVLVVASVTT